MLKKDYFFASNGLVLFSFTLIVLGNSYNLGFYFLPGLIFILIAFCLLFSFYVGNISLIFGSFTQAGSLGFLLVLFIALSMGMYGGMYQENIYNLQQISRYLLMLALGLSLFYVLDFSKTLLWLNRYKFIVLVLVALLLRIFIVISSPKPFIDVFDIQKAAPRVLISGHDPYSVSFLTWSGEYYNAFTYGPAVLLLDLPAVLILNDPRYTMIFAEMGTALLLFIMLKRNKYMPLATEVIPLLFLFQPRAVFAIEQAWVDPLVVFALTLFVYLLFFRKRLIVSSVVLGVAIASKQYSILLLPFLMKSRWYSLKQLMVSLASALIVMLPFIVWNFRDFVNDVILLNLIIEPRYDSNSLNSLIHEMLGVDIPTYVYFALILLLFLTLFRKMTDKPYSIILAGALSTLGMFLLYKLAFLHYYYYAGSLVLISVVLLVVMPHSDKKVEHK